MTNNDSDDKKSTQQLLEEYFHRKENIPFNEWKQRASEKCKELENSSDIMLGILEEQWKSISYHELSRKEYYNLKNSPLEILQFCIADDFLTYPPPEILWVISMQFQRYMESQGHITLEEAFFGKPIKGKGCYAKRIADKYNQLYQAFHRKLRVNPEYSQAHLLERFCTTPSSDALSLPTKDTCMEIFNENQVNEIDIDSFLRGYRRWKENTDNQTD